MKCLYCLLFLSVTALSPLASPVIAGDPDTSGYDSVVATFTQGPFGAVVAVGQDKTAAVGVLRFGAAANIGVSPESYDKYRFAIYVEARNEKGEIVKQNAAVMAKPLQKGDPGRTGTYIEHAKAPAGSYTITAVLSAIAKDGSVTVLDQGKTITVVMK
jgi:hypothetical protein